MKSRFKLGLGSTFSRGQGFLGTRQNTVRKTSMNCTADWNLSPNDWFSLDFTAKILKNTWHYSPDAHLGQSNFDQNYLATLTVLLPGHWDFRSDLDLLASSSRAAAGRQTVAVWNVSLGKHLLQGEKLEISLSVNDLLNRNTALKRTANLNFVENEQSNILSRCFFLRARYRMVEI